MCYVRKGAVQAMLAREVADYGYAEHGHTATPEATRRSVAGLVCPASVFVACDESAAAVREGVVWRGVTLQ